MIFCYTPHNKHTRIYISAISLEGAMKLQDEVWEQIKASYYWVGSYADEITWWDNDEEAEEARREWFTHWDIPAYWKSGSIHVDSHY